MRNPSRRPLRAAVAVLALALLVGPAIAVWATVRAKPAGEAATATVATTTAPVTRGTASEQLRVPGTYGFDGTYSVMHQGAAGIVTSAARPGARVSRGGVLYSVDARAVRLLYGSVPAYRDFRLGMADGPDVRQLEQNLVALGMDRQHALDVDRHFSRATAAAIRRWQRATGLPAARRTGVLSLGDVVFLPVPLRISRIASAVGTATGANQPVLEATSTAHVVTADVTADRQSSVHAGDPAVVSLPGGLSAQGRVLRTFLVAPATGDQGGDRGDEGAAAPSIRVVIRLTAPDRMPELDQAPVLVSIAAVTHHDVLLVPVSALLARPGGGYQVRLASGAVVPVEPHLFDEATGKVEVDGDLSEGERVEVPLS